MAWNLYEGEKFLEPLKFSNGKTQEDVVNEVLGEIKKGYKVIFIHGVCGTGKSAIALNIAKNLGKASIVVPGKALQSQYKEDYEGKKYLLKEGKELAGERVTPLGVPQNSELGGKLKISVITGRNNHSCKFLEDNSGAIPKIKKEVNATLNDIFGSERNEQKLEQIRKDLSADNYELPCKIELKEKNFPKIKEYLRQNQHVKTESFSSAMDVTRVPVAAVCPYWSPVMPDIYELKGPLFEGAKKRQYEGLDGNHYIFYQRRRGCAFYEQFNSYIDSDVIVFNSQKYKLETALNRKPRTEVEIIDECDEFLDSFTNQKSLNLDRVLNSLNYVFSSEEFVDKMKKEITEIILHMKRDENISTSALAKEIIPLKKTGVYDLIRLALKNPEFFLEIDDENYLFEFQETAKMFKEFLNEAYVTFEKQENSLRANIVTTNLAKKFKEIVDKNKIFVLMSGTLHAESILRGVFGIDDFIKIDAEVTQHGQIEVVKTGKEMDCKYSNFSSGKYTREDYFNSLSKCVEFAKKPCLVHVNAFMDLPSEEEIIKYDIRNLISREELIETQRVDKTGRGVLEFKEGKKNVLFSTRSARGIDFPGEQCNSIIFTKYPNPNVQDPFWKILAQTKPTFYWEFYRDKAKRELWQRVYRGLRFKEDHVNVLSPDSRVLDAFMEDSTKL